MYTLYKILSHYTEESTTVGFPQHGIKSFVRLFPPDLLSRKVWIERREVIRCVSSVARSQTNGIGSKLGKGRKERNFWNGLQVDVNPAAHFPFDVAVALPRVDDGVAAELVSVNCNAFWPIRDYTMK